MSFLDKALSIAPQDIVSVTHGRSWLRARVVKVLPDNMLLVRFKNGRQTKVSADHVLTEQEKKNFRKTKGQTNIVRGSNDEESPPEFNGVQDSEEEDTEPEEKRFRFKKLF